MADNTQGIAPDNDIVIAPGQDPTFTALVINQTLAKGGLTTLTRAGTYIVNDTLLIPSNTNLHLGAGVTIKLANNTSKALVANKNAFTLGTPIVSALQFRAPEGLSPRFGMLLNKTGIAAEFPVGSYIGIMGLSSSVNDQCYQGVWEVTEHISANSIVFNIDQQPVGGVDSATSGSYWRVDTNITISGSGTLDGNQANQAFNTTVIHAGDPRSNLTWFRNVKKLRIQDITIRRALSWGISSNNVDDYQIVGIIADVYLSATPRSTDAIHLAGGHRRVLIQGATFRDSDNMVGMTIDLPGAPSNSGIVESYAQFYAPGDTHSIVIRDLFVTDSSTPAVIGIWGPTSYRHNSIIIDGVHGKSGGAIVGMLPYSPTNMLGCTGGMLVVRNITALCSSPILDLKGDGTWDLISLETVRNATSQSNIIPLVNVGRTTTLQTIKHLRVAQFHAPLVNAISRTAQVCTFGEATVENLDVQDFRGSVLGAAVPLILFDGTTGSYGNVVISNCQASSSAAGASAITKVTGATPINSISFVGCNFTGSAGTGNMVDLAAAAVVSKVQFSASDVTTAAGLFTSAANVARLNGANAQFNGSNITAPIPGDTFYNTNAVFGLGVGLYARGAATWTRIAP